MFEKEGNNLILQIPLEKNIVTIAINDYYKYYDDNNNFFMFNDTPQTPTNIKTLMDMFKAEISKDITKARHITKWCTVKKALITII